MMKIVLNFSIFQRSLHLIVGGHEVFCYSNIYSILHIALHFKYFIYKGQLYPVTNLKDSLNPLEYHESEAGIFERVF